MVTYPVWVLLFSIFGLVSASAASPQLQGVRFGSQGAFARVVFDLQESTPYRVVASSDPLKIIVEFPGIRQAPRNRAGTERSLIQEVRFVTTSAKTISEIKLTQPGKVHRHFRTNSPPRIVIDIVRHQSQRSVRHAAASRAKPQTPKHVSNTPKNDQAQPIEQITQPQPQQQQTDEREEVSPTEVSTQLPPTLSHAQLLRKAADQWNRQDFKAAQQTYSALLERFPNYPYNHLIAVRLADILQEQKQYREALAAYASIPEEYPGSEGAVVSQIRMAELGAQSPGLVSPDASTRYEPYQRPLKALRQVIQSYSLSPLADVARFKIGVISARKHDLQTALQTFRELLKKPLKEDLRREVEEHFRQTLHRMLIEHQNQENFLEVLRTFFANKEQLAPQDAVHPDLLLPVAMSYAHLDLLPEAQSLLQMQIDASPTSQQLTKVALAEVLVKREEFDEAKALLVPLEPNAAPTVRGRILLLLGTIALHEKHPRNAVHYLRIGDELLTSPTDRTRMFSLLAEGYIAQGEQEKGVQALQDCAEIVTEEKQLPVPAAEDCLFRAGEVLSTSGQYKRALAAYQTLLDTFPTTSRRDHILLRMAGLSRELADTPQMLDTLTTLRDTTSNALWQKVADEYLGQVQWQKRFHERLAEFQNRLTR